MTNEVDEHFYDRADAHIALANAQMREAGPGHASASMLYGTSRFNVWVTACGCDSSEALAARREETLDYFVAQYRKMLQDNLDDYITNFASYMSPRP